MKRTIIIIVAIALVAAGGYFLWQRQQTIAQEGAFEILREAVIENGRISSTVNATGSIEPESLLTLTFGVGGTVQKVNAVRGQNVTVDDILAAVDTAELELAVQQAQDALNIQELTAQQRQNAAPSPATLIASQADIDAAAAQLLVSQANLAAAEAAVLQAQAQRSQLLAGATAGQIAGAEASVAAAQQSQKSAEVAHDRTMECGTLPNGSEICPGLGATEEQARAALNSANIGLIAAQAQLNDLNEPARPADIQGANAAIASAEANVLAAEGNIAAAEANVTRAQAAYDRLLEGITDDDLAILQAQIASAETNLAIGELRLQQAQLIAPIQGTVANVLVHEGEQAVPGAPAMTILNENAFHLDVHVDEIDIDQLAVGQMVDVTLDALSKTAVSGTIAEIAPTANNISGVVTYLVTINIEADEETVLRPGMSASASIIVDELDDVLIVPNWAIRFDRESGIAYVNIQRPDGVIEEVAVETGLRNEQFSEVLSGVNAGDIVVITNEREAFNLLGN